MDNPKNVDHELAEHLSPYFLQRFLHNDRAIYKIDPATLAALCNEIFGQGNWHQSERNIKVEHVSKSGQIELLTSIIIRVTLSDGTFHEDIGYGMAKDADPEAAVTKSAEYARKNGLARCLRQFGNALGNCLSREYIAIIEENLKHELQ